MNAMERIMVLARHGEVIRYARQLQVLSDLAFMMETQGLNICLIQRNQSGGATLLSDERTIEVPEATNEDIYEALSGLFMELDEIAFSRRQLQQAIRQEQVALEEDERLQALDQDLINLASHIKNKNP